MAKLIDITGKALSGEWGSEDVSGQGIPILRTTNFTNEGTIDYSSVVTRTVTKKNIRDKFLKNGDIIIEKSGGSDKQPVGRVVYFDSIENKYLFNNFTGLLRVKDKNKWLPKYVFYSLFSAYKQGKTKYFENRTTGLHNLQTDSYIKNLEIKDVPIHVQQKECDILDNICGQVMLRKKQLSQYDQIVNARFVEMFGDLALNPKNWTQVSLREVCKEPDDIKCGPFGTQLGKDEYLSDGIPVWGIPQINKNFQIPTYDFVSYEKATELSKFSLLPGDIAMSRKGNVGKCAIYPIGYPDGIIHSDVLRIRVDRNICNPIFLMYQLHFSRAVETQINLVSHGAIMAGINVSKLKNIQIHIPSITLQNDFETFVQKADKSKVAIKRGMYYEHLK